MRLAFAFAAAMLALALTPALAQPYRGPDLAAQQAAMSRLSTLAGRWQGEATVSGEHAMTVHQVEEVTSELDGRLLVFRGTGHETPQRTGAPVFQALGVVSYDDARDIYEMRTYAYGYAATSTGVFTPDGAFVWTTPMFGQTQSRYTIRFDADTWHELGEMTRDGGATWTRTVELNLRRAR